MSAKVGLEETEEEQGKNQNNRFPLPNILGKETFKPPSIRRMNCICNNILLPRYICIYLHFTKTN